MFLALLVFAVYQSLLLSDDMQRLLLKEGGVVETASAVGYFACLVLLFWKGSKRSVRSHWYLYVLLLAMGLRELDFDKRFTSTGILKSKFLIADDVGPFAKIVGGAVVLLVLYAFVTWIASHYKEFARDIRKLRTAAWAAGIGLVFVVVTKSVDGVGRKLEPFGIDVTVWTIEFASIFEEVFELGIPITLFYAIYLYWQPLRRK